MQHFLLTTAGHSKQSQYLPKNVLNHISFHLFDTVLNSKTKLTADIG